MPIDMTPYVLCIDVGGPKKVGWADTDGYVGTGSNLGEALSHLSDHLRGGSRAALGFEAPIWTPTREDFARITGCRGGVEKEYNRAWSAGAGTGALGAALALMPWCMTQIVRNIGSVITTVDLRQFQARGGLFLWEAFVSGHMKVPGASHHDDARVACDAFAARWPSLTSDIPEEPALNHAVSSALCAGLDVDPKELVSSALVVGITSSTRVETTS